MARLHMWEVCHPVKDKNSYTVSPAIQSLSGSILFDPYVTFALKTPFIRNEKERISFS